MAVAVIAAILIGNVLALCYLARKVAGLEDELLGVYMDLYDRMGASPGPESPPRVSVAVKRLRELRADRRPNRPAP